MLEMNSTNGPDQETDPFEGTAYRFKERIAAGGMGEVFLVEHRNLGRDWIAKVLHASLATDAQIVDRFRLEAQTLGRLNHPHIVSAVGYSKTRDGRPFIVQEHLRGRSLSEEIEARGGLPVFEAVTYACQLLSALEAVHALGIVHRDIKPDNLYVCEHPTGARYLKVLDFGVVRVLLGVSEDAPLPPAVPTETGVVVGTPKFTSPEGAMGRKVDHRADIYSAGLVLYIMLTGQGPFDHVLNSSRQLVAHAAAVPKAPSRVAAGVIPAELDRVVLRALSKKAADRFQNAREFWEALIAAAGRSPSGIWTTTDTLRAEAALAAAADVPNGLELPEDLVSLQRTAAEPLPTPASEERRLGRLASSLIFLVIVVTTAIGVALLTGVFRGGERP